MGYNILGFLHLIQNRVLKHSLSWLLYHLSCMSCISASISAELLVGHKLKLVMEQIPTYICFFFSWCKCHGIYIFSYVESGQSNQMGWQGEWSFSWHKNRSCQTSLSGFGIFKHHIVLWWHLKLFVTIVIVKLEICNSTAGQSVLIDSSYVLYLLDLDFCLSSKRNQCKFCLNSTQRLRTQHFRIFQYE